MRNVFDQYDQPENRLTHALMITLANDKRLIRPFLKLVCVKRIPALNKIQLGLQCVPGQEVNSNKDGKEGLPDGCFFDQDGWAVVIEAKVQAGISVNQLKRHRKTLARYGYEQPYVVLLSIDKPKSLPDWVTHLEWKKLYSWFSRRTADSSWARHYKSQRSYPETDGRVEVDLRTVLSTAKGLLKHQPGWLECIFELLVNKKTNMQWGIELHCSHSEKVMQSAKAIDIMVDSWVAMMPLMDFVTSRKRPC